MTFFISLPDWEGTGSEIGRGKLFMFPCLPYDTNTVFSQEIKSDGTFIFGMGLFFFLGQPFSSGRESSLSVQTKHQALMLLCYRVNLREE